MTGVFGTAAAERRAALERDLVATPLAAQVEHVDRPRFSATASSRVTTCAKKEHAGVSVLVEGTLGGFAASALVGRGTPAERLARALARTSGSFVVTASNGEWVALGVDATASRPMFYALDGASLLFGPEVAPLARALPRLTLDRANVMQLLANGRMFAGGSPALEIRRLLPGETLSWDGERLSRAFHYRYEVEEPDPASGSEEGMLRDLERKIDEAIVARYEAARDGAVLLSGGYDSRYIYHVLLRHLGEGRRVRTLTWGCHLEREGSDAWCAAALAARHGSDFVAIPRDPAMTVAHFAEHWAAQNGLTELAFAHSDEWAICRELRGRHGVRAIFRGDEVFGPSGPREASPDAVRHRVGLVPAALIDESEAWLLGDAGPWVEAHSREALRVSTVATDDLDDMRDTLYGGERLAAHNHPLSYHKSHFLDVVNPLLERTVLDANRRLPRRARRDKALFRRSYERRFGDFGQVPLAVASNALDWARAIRDRPDVVSFFEERLRKLPPPFAADYFMATLQRVRAGEVRREGVRAFAVPSVQLLMRAVVLSEWLTRFSFDVRS